MEPEQWPVILFTKFLNKVEDAEPLITDPEMNSSEKRRKLEEEIAQARKPKQKISLMNDLAMELHHAEPEQALKVAAMAAELAADIHFVQGIARSHFSAGMAYLVLSKYEESLYAFGQAREAFREVKDKWGESNTLNNLGLLHQHIGDYGKALDFYAESVKMKEESGDNYGQCNVEISLAGLHREAGNLPQARQEIEKALRIAEEINAPPLLAKGLTEQGIILFELNELDEAQQIFSQAKKWYSAQQNIFGLIQSSIQSGRVSKARGRMDEALAIFRQALALCEQNGDKHAAAAILFELATLDTPEIHSPDRRQHLLAALDSAEQLNDRPLLKKICDALSDHFEKESRFDVALDFYKKSQHLCSEMNVAEIASRMQNMEISRRMELLEREKKLLEMEKMAALGQLTAGVAHEINIPVKFVASNISPVRKNIEDILGVLHRCEEIINEFSSEEKKAELKQLRSDYDLDYSIEEIDRLLKGIENGASRIREIVSGLRTFTHHDEEEFKAADIHEGINAAITLLSSRMRNSITIEKQFGDVPPFEHYPSLLNQAFMHIIMNAAEAIDNIGIITIKTFKEDSRIAIEISDTGKGMTDDVKRKMFNPFYTTKDVGEGTGLGLALTRNIMEKHHGKIEVLSEKGKGTTVRLLLPGVHSDSSQ